MTFKTSNEFDDLTSSGDGDVAAAPPHLWLNAPMAGQAESMSLIWLSIHQHVIRAEAIPSSWRRANLHQPALPALHRRDRPPTAPSNFGGPEEPVGPPHRQRWPTKRRPLSWTSEYESQGLDACSDSNAARSQPPDLLSCPSPPNSRRKRACRRSYIHTD